MDRMQQSVALYFLVGIVLCALGSMTQGNRKAFREARRDGVWSLLAVSFGMAGGVLLWPVVLVAIGVSLMLRRRKPKLRAFVRAADLRPMSLRQSAELEKVGPGQVVGIGSHVQPGRKFVCVLPCPRCGAGAALYEGDERSAPCLRVECPAGHRGDLGPDSCLIPEGFRKRGV